jgi:nucleotide-binding universal stress UspA family protein
MFKTILLALDGSDAARNAIPAATDLARSDGGRIVVAHVDEHIAGKGGTVSVRADEPALKEAIQKTADELAADGLEVTVELANNVIGGPAHTIAKIADDVGADVIVIGTRGHTALAGLVVGGVAHRLLHIAHRPVLAVPPAA